MMHYRYEQKRLQRRKNLLLLRWLSLEQLPRRLATIVMRWPLGVQPRRRRDYVVAGVSSLTGRLIEATPPPPRKYLMEEEADKVLVLPTTSSHQKTNWKQQKIKKGSRCNIHRNFLYHIAKESQCVSVPSSQATTYNMYGTIVNCNSSKGWDVQFGIFSLEENMLRYINRNKIMVMDSREDSPDCNRLC
jgi:hypothetical protein